MSDNWLAVALYTAVVIGVGVAMITLGAIFGPRKRQAAKAEPYECGAPLLSGARERFSVHFYLVAILFIIFDVEAIYFYPWAAVFHELSWYGLGAMTVFTIPLVVGFVYEWMKGGLEW